MKIDDASWHYNAKDFPESLPPEAGATHIGIFFAWLALHDLLSEQLLLDLGKELDLLRQRSIAPGEFIWRFLDGILSDHDLNDQGKEFADSYYQSKPGDNSFLSEYEWAGKTSGKSEYFTPDNWETYHEFSIFIDDAYKQWNKIKALEP